MLMTAGAVNMTVLDLFFSGITDIHYLHIKSQLYTGQGMVAIDIYIKPTDFQHSNLHLALIGL